MAQDPVSDAHWNRLVDNIEGVTTNGQVYKMDGKMSNSICGKLVLVIVVIVLAVFLVLAGVTLHKVNEIERKQNQGLKVEIASDLNTPDVTNAPVHEDTTEEPCNDYLGMESGEIPDDAITAYTFYGAGHEPYQARLNLQPNGTSAACWAAKGVAGDWIQVDLQRVRTVSGVITQGRPSTAHQQWLEQYMVLYGDKIEMLQYVKEDGSTKIFDGNHDSFTPHISMFPTPVQARYIRILPAKWHGNCMRFELTGC